MNLHVCACGSSEGIRKRRNANIWLCPICQETWKREYYKRSSSIRYTSFREAAADYEDHLEHPRTSKSWPRDFEDLWEEFICRDLHLSQVANKFGLRIQQVLLWYNRCKNILPGGLSGRLRNRLCSHKVQVAKAFEDFKKDPLFREFRKESETRGLSLELVPKYDKGRFVGYKSGRAKVRWVSGNLRIVNIYQTNSVYRHSGTIYWAWSIRIRQIKDRIDGGVIVLQAHRIAPKLCFFIIPIRDIPEEYFDRKEIVINIPVNGWSSKSIRRPTINWFVYRDNWNEFMGSKKTMAHATLVSREQPAKGSIAS